MAVGQDLEDYASFIIPWQKILVGSSASLKYSEEMEHFRHNLSPVEIKIFLKTVAPLTDNLLIRYCHKIVAHCPECGHQALCRSAAISVFSSSIDKITHEITVCLKCGYKNLSTVLTCERL